MFKKVKEIIPELYMVGGSVRDIYLEKTPKDYDFCTPYSPDEIETLIRKAGKKPYLIGKRFGTVGMKVDSQLVEITTFRSEKYVQGSRKPTVEFVTDLKEDLSRRDFTINSLAYNGDIIDYFNGISDLELGVIRAVGIPKHRFNEDPLRILRACRFSSQFNFEIEEKTLSAMKKTAHSILNISKERWVAELDKILLTDIPSVGFYYLHKCGVLKYILPELDIQYNYNQNSHYHDFDLWTHTMMVVNKTQGLEMRWAALLHDIAKPFVRTENKKGHSNYIFHERLGKEMVLKLGKYLKFSNDHLKIVSTLVAEHLNESSALKFADDSSKKGEVNV